ncbi:uncharacterized protein E0L32_007392 [Thyridium curvatum]|uniref:[histone H3]-trimethyl-L-lysine(9) demethylase n=1 Tax=Thyridium curvatum TaxID=1093900 RepID=A0A507AZM4_9PEZI|nr:uncharacterized protein E0L32_007392 [Thyridium curvatum]TPX11894.1 hypothetical protein E0L32_007392 [Thyridium curvatum]
MATEAIGAAAPVVDGDTIAVAHPFQPKPDDASKPTGLNSPPDSNNAMKLDGSDDSELSDLDDAVTDGFKFDPEDDIGEIEPDHFSGTVPVFRPTMHQFKDFKRFMEKIDQYGMKSGIVKVIPPQEWKDSLPALDELVKTIRVRDPIKQDIMGSNGTYRQVNILHQRSYNLPQWRQLCDQSEHQPPARRGERRANADKPKPTPRPRPANAASAAGGSSKKGKRGKTGKGKGKSVVREETAESEARPMTPESPKVEPDTVLDSVEGDPAIKIEETEETFEEAPAPRRMGFTRQASTIKTQSTSARRKYAKREGSAKIDEAAFKDWDYHMDISDYTPERCEELERVYWKTLTYAPPLYGADLQGTLFDESTELWNLNKLPNLLDVLGTKVPGVNTAYLYLGMWKATFAWHLEDVDLYSINYLHFGAPKQWYSISQGDARRFEAAMKNIWPTDAKACDQFLRHKAFLISPNHLQQHYGIKVNKVVSYPGEFVVTYPYGYHSGYNLGYNCAEAVNFALDSWLPMGKIAKRCECAQAQDSVWVDVYEIERKLRGESTEYEETEDEEDEEDEDEADDSTLHAHGSTIRIKAPSKKRKRDVKDKGNKKVKKIRLRLKAHVEPPCCLCPNDFPGAELLPTDDGRKAHRLCALYLPETYIETEDGREVITNATSISKARLDLKCLFCRSKKGACFQCSQKKCARSYHATCAASAGVFVEEAEVPVFGEDGTEYKEQAFEFSCRFHRTKRDKKLDGEALEKNARVRDAAAHLTQGQFCQLQYYRGDIFAGVVVENRADEETLLVDIIPGGDRVEVEWKWLLLPDPADFKLPKASPNALPLPSSRSAKDKINAKKRPGKELPRAEDAFVEGFTWAEFHTCEESECTNSEQVRIDFAKTDQVWHYLGRTSTETKAQYTEDPARPQYNPKSHFLDSIPKPLIQRPSSTVMGPPRRSYSTINPPYVPHTVKEEKPYVYKPRKNFDYTFPPQNPQQSFSSQAVGSATQQSFNPDPRFVNAAQYYGTTGFPAAQGQASSSRPTTPSGPFLNGYSAVPAAQSWSKPGPGQSHGPSHGKAAKGFARPPRPNHPSAILPPPAPVKLSATCQKYAFFQVNHNRESSSYRTPYARWGGFTNGYEGNLREHLMSTGGAGLHKRSSSFGLGGGLKGLTRPSPYLNYNSPPPSSSSASSPYLSTKNNFFGTASSASSYTSYDAFGNKLSSMSPTLGSYAGSPTTPLGGYELSQSNSPMLHPAIRTPFGTSWQQNLHATLGQYSPVDADFSPPSSITNTPSTTPLNSFPLQPAPLLGDFLTQTTYVTPVEDPPSPEASADQTPAEQLKQQLRRISDPLPSSYSLPHPDNEREHAAHAPVSSQIPLPMPSPAQASPPKPQQSQPDLHQPAVRLQPELKLGYGAHHVGADIQHQQAPRRLLPPRLQTPIHELAEVPPNSMGLVDQILSNLKQACGEDKRS